MPEDQPPKFVQHDADPAADDRTIDERPIEEIMADAIHPDDYVMSSQEAMDSALEQAAAADLPAFGVPAGDDQ